MNYRVRRALFTAVMVVAMLAAMAATAAEAPETLPEPNEGVTQVDGDVDKANAAEIDHTAEPAAWVAVDRVDAAADTAEMTGQATEQMGPPTAAMRGLGASSATAEVMGSPPANVGHVEDAAAENAVRIQGMGNSEVADIPVYKPHEVAERAGPVAVAAPTYEHRAPETPAPDIANLEPQGKFQQDMGTDVQEGMGIPSTIAFG